MQARSLQLECTRNSLQKSGTCPEASRKCISRVNGDPHDFQRHATTLPRRLQAQSPKIFYGRCSNFNLYIQKPGMLHACVA